MGETYRVWMLALPPEFDQPDAGDAVDRLPRACRESDILHHQIYRGNRPAYYAISRYSEARPDSVPEIGGLLESPITGALHKAALWLDRNVNDEQMPYQVRLLHVPERLVTAIWLTRHGEQEDENLFLVVSAPMAKQNRRRNLRTEAAFAQFLHKLNPAERFHQAVASTG
ncbi:hypothetical protein [Burkholderia cepacia]|uniref:hypothetical protein n=1 Tax=Burkholderia cepacia TaxID=292 RepID=UPI0012D865ED|nr:hypothetical protein [Burkholderia cepacia]